MSPLLELNLIAQRIEETDQTDSITSHQNDSTHQNDTMKSTSTSTMNNGGIRKERAKRADSGGLRRITRGMTTDASRRAVFDTSELLEGILVHLPISDVARVSRVSRQFGNQVNKSPQLQQNLFRKAEEPKEIWKVIRDVTNLKPNLRFIRSRLIKSTASYADTLAHHQRAEAEQSDATLFVPAFTLNPLFEDLSRKWSPDSTLAKRSCKYPWSKVKAKPYLKTLMRKVLNGTKSPLLDTMHIMGITIATMTVHFNWTIGDVNGVTKVNLDTRAGRDTVGEVLKALLDDDSYTIRKRSDDGDDSKMSLRDRIEKDKANGGPGLRLGMLQVPWEFTFFGIILPTQEERDRVVV